MKSLVAFTQDQLQTKDSEGKNNNIMLLSIFCIVVHFFTLSCDGMRKNGVEEVSSLNELNVLSLEGLKKVKKINLSFENTPTIPAKVFLCPNLESLSLYKTNLCSVPDEIIKLKKLSFLNIGSNPISHISNKIKLLDNLEQLEMEELSDFFLTDSNIVFSKNIKSLNINFNKIDDIQFVCNLKQLTKLSLVGCGIESLPNCIVTLKKLEELNLSNNKVSAFPVGLLEGKNMKSIVVTDNSFDKDYLKKISAQYPKINFVTSDW